MTPKFKLLSAKNKWHSLSDYRGKIVVLEWLNYDCPFVKKHYESGNMQKLQKSYTEQGVVWLSIISSAKGKQGNYPPLELLGLHKNFAGNATEILRDASGDVGRSYGAKTTPHMYIIGKNGRLLYEGAIDDQPSFDKKSIAKARNYVREALDLTLKNKKVLVAKTRPYGCSVKY